MLHVIHPNRWFWWAIALIVIVGLFVWWKVEEYGIEEETMSYEQMAVATSTSANIKALSKSKSQGVSSGLSTQKPLRLVVPNGGQVWHRGKGYEISWKTTLPATVTISAYLVPTESLITNIYAISPASIKPGYQMLVPAGFPNDKNQGSYEYVVPASVVLGRYQVMVFGGKNCGPSLRQEICAFDASDGFITVVK